MDTTLVGIAGALLGIIVTYLVNLRIEQVKSKLDRKLHLDEARSVAYAEFMSTSAQAFDEWLDYHHQVKTSKRDTATLKTLHQEVRKTHHNSWTPFQKVKILSTRPVAMAAGKVWDTLTNARRGEYNESVLKENMSDAENGFIAAVKKELGLDQQSDMGKL